MRILQIDHLFWGVIYFFAGVGVFAGVEYSSDLISVEVSTASPVNEDEIFFGRSQIFVIGLVFMLLDSSVAFSVTIFDKSITSVIMSSRYAAQLK